MTIMKSKRAPTLFTALASATTVLAHGHVSNIIINGVSFQGFDPTTMPYMKTKPVVVGWTTQQTDNGFVEPSAYGSPDIICHKAATPAQGHAQVAAGDSISIQWNVWPDSHHGPMLDYLAPCNGPCESVDKTALQFFKIDSAGIIDQGSPGVWADDVLIRNNNTWVVQIPSGIKAGNYVLRHETIALHSAGQQGGAQNYPQCFNLEVTGDGTDEPAGVPATALYKENDPGIVVNIYTSSVDYQIPGPTLIANVQPTAPQTPSPATSTASATPGSGGWNATAPDAPANTSGGGSSADSAGGAALYAQCGGNGFSGPTTCAEGTCTKRNDFYSQCTPN